MTRRARRLRPIARASSGRRGPASSAAASAALSPPGTILPVTPSATACGSSPTSLATTGRAMVIARWTTPLCDPATYGAATTRAPREHLPAPPRSRGSGRASVTRPRMGLPPSAGPRRDRSRASARRRSSDAPPDAAPRSRRRPRSARASPFARRHSPKNRIVSSSRAAAAARRPAAARRRAGSPRRSRAVQARGTPRGCAHRGRTRRRRARRTRAAAPSSTGELA